MILGRPRACVNGCGALVEFSFDRRRRVVLVESSSRERHTCPKRLVGAYVQCPCGATVHTYADGAVEDVRSRLPHACTKKPIGAEAPARGAAFVAPPPIPSPAPEPPRVPTPSLAEQLGL